MAGLMMTCSNSVAGSVRKPVVRNGWDAKWFDYDRPGTLAVAETTPTPRQLHLARRPPQVTIRPTDPLHASVDPAPPRTLCAMNVVHLRFRDAEGDVVPALLWTP